jgi:hypothetical protein
MPSNLRLMVSWYVLLCEMFRCEQLPNCMPQWPWHALQSNCTAKQCTVEHCSATVGPATSVLLILCCCRAVKRPALAAAPSAE